jgi:hypothetical protein
MIMARLLVLASVPCLAFQVMALRTFTASDGRPWTVWLVQPSTRSPLLGAPGAWLAFQNEDGSERRRLRVFPTGWADLSDERLDLLRRMADPVKPHKGRHSPPGSHQVMDDGDAES